MRINHTREERRKIIEECMQSGKTQIEFAREHGIKPNTLSGWITEFRKESVSQPADNHFVELKKPATPEDYLRCLFERAPYAETHGDWEKLLPWNIEITPYKIRGEWM